MPDFTGFFSVLLLDCLPYIWYTVFRLLIYMYGEAALISQIKAAFLLRFFSVAVLMSFVPFVVAPVLLFKSVDFRSFPRDFDFILRHCHDTAAKPCPDVE